MTSRHMTSSTSLIIREMKINATTMSYHLTPVRITIIKKQTNNKFGLDVEKREPLCIFWPQVNSREGIQLHP